MWPVLPHILEVWRVFICFYLTYMFKKAIYSFFLKFYPLEEHVVTLSNTESFINKFERLEGTTRIKRKLNRKVFKGKKAIDITL